MASNESNPSSEVSIEEIGAEQPTQNDKQEDAEEIITDDSKGPRDEQGDSQAVEVLEREDDTLIQSRKGGDSEDDEDNDFGDDDFEDETIMERIVGLSEMFPESVRKGTSALFFGSIGLAQSAYSMSRLLAWVAFSSSAIMFLPILIESERVGIEESQKQQQRQILLGPGAAVSGGSSSNLAPNAPLPPPAM